MFNCSKCNNIMTDYVSFLAPTYLTYMCNNCGGIFYDLVDAAKLEEIKAAVVQNVAEALDVGQPRRKRK